MVMKKTLFVFITIAGILHNSTIQGQYRDRNTDSLIVSALGIVSSDSLVATVQSLQDFGTRFMMAPNRRDIATFLMERLVSYGVPEVRLDSFPCYTLLNAPPYLVYDTTTWQYNVEAKITGSIWPSREIVMMAHYDDIVNDADPMDQAPGADDNASGVAALLESARVIMATGYQPAQTMIFLVTAAEELNTVGGSGSRHYAEEASAVGRDLSMVINNDMIGWNDGSWTLSMINDPESQRVTDLASHVIDSYTTLERTFASIGTYCDLKYFLYEEYEGIYFMENIANGWFPYYHTLNDLRENIDSAYLAENTKVNLGCFLFSDLLQIDAALLMIDNIPEVTCSGSLSPVVTVANYGSDTLISMDIVCQVNGEDPVTFPWNGSLAFRETQQVELSGIFYSVLPENELVVTLTNINGADDEIPVNNAHNVSFGMAQATPSEVKLKIMLDNHPQETTWEIKNNLGDIIYTGGPYATPNVMIQETFVLDEPGCYSFSVFDEGGDGLQPGFVLLYYGSNSVILSVMEFGSMIRTEFDVGGTLEISEIAPSDGVAFYPNPITDIGYIDFHLTKGTLVEIELYNSLGQKLLELVNHHYVPGNHHIQYATAGLSPGIYFITYRIGAELKTGTLIKR